MQKTNAVTMLQFSHVNIQKVEIQSIYFEQMVTTEQPTWQGPDTCTNQHYYVPR